MVYHLKSSHPDSEVYVSRVSPQMNDLIRKSSFTAIKFKKKNNLYLRFTCVFCEKEIDYSAYHWADHIRTHTGEYARKCCLCNKSTNLPIHCNVSTEQIYILDKNNDLDAFICDICNYVQLDDARMVEHLRHHHDDDENPRYSMFKILPAVNRLRLQENPNEAINCGKPKMCSITVGHIDFSLEINFI